MFTQPAPTPPTLASPTTPLSPASPHRPSRLRGLSYLRNFNHTHLHSRDNHSDNSANTRRLSLGRATSYPSPTSNASASRQGGLTARLLESSAERGPPVDRENTGGLGNIESAGGWVPTVGGQSAAVSRIATQPLSTPTDSASALLALRDIEDSNTLSTTMGRTRTANTNRLSANRLSMSNMPQLTEGQDTQPQYVPVAAQPKDSINSLDNGNQLPSIRFSQHQDVRAPRPSLVFSSMTRTLPSGRETIRVGRYSERENLPGPASNVPSAAPIGFKSKVVSRRHCEFWFQDGLWFIKDVKSSSGTFLNHVRLSSPGTESKPFPIKDGDIVQLGIDFKGGEEMIFRCVKIRIELNRGWQSALNSFNVASHKRLRNMAKQNPSPTGGSSQDCTICLGPVAPCQSLFVAPCSHTWHYKCVRRIINSPTWPQFICPNCRAVADLDADVDEPFPEADWEEAGVADMDEQHLAEESNHDMNAATLLQQPTIAGQLETNGASRTNGVSPRIISQDHSRKDTIDVESELHRAVDFLAIAPYGNSTDPSQDSNITRPLNIRSTRSTSKRDGSNTRVDGSEAEHPNRNDRTPSPSGNILNDGPLTPRNNAGPFVFDGSGGRLSQEGMPTLNLTATAEMSPHDI